MKRRLKILARVCLVIVSCLVCLNIVFFIARTFFFDKLFYQKSTHFGYILKNKDALDSIYFDRNHDLTDLKKGVAIPSNKKVYKIAVFGDSYVWGQGITNNERFVTLLEARLNSIHPTKIYSFAQPADSLFDNYVKFKQTQTLSEQFDLVIFGLVDNDLILNSAERYDRKIAELAEKACPSGQEISINQLSTTNYEQLVEKSVAPDSKNYCEFKYVLPFLPKQNAFFFNFDELTDNSLPLKQISSNLKNAGLTVVSPLPYYLVHRRSYRDFWTYDSIKPLDQFLVSKMEGHPSAIANRLFSDALFQEITTNPNWHFSK